MISTHGGSCSGAPEKTVKLAGNGSKHVLGAALLSLMHHLSINDSHMITIKIALSIVTHKITTLKITSSGNVAMVMLISNKTIDNPRIQKASLFLTSKKIAFFF
jgi:hypothetical protein